MGGCGSGSRFSMRRCGAVEQCKCRPRSCGECLCQRIQLGQSQAACGAMQVARCVHAPLPASNNAAGIHSCSPPLDHPAALFSLCPSSLPHSHSPTSTFCSNQQQPAPLCRRHLKAGATVLFRLFQRLPGARPQHSGLWSRLSHLPSRRCPLSATRAVLDLELPGCACASSPALRRSPRPASNLSHARTSIFWS